MTSNNHNGKSWTLGSIFLNGNTGTKSLTISIYGKSLPLWGSWWNNGEPSPAQKQKLALQQPGEGEEAENIRMEGQTAWAGWEQFTRLVWPIACFVPLFLKENVIEISASTHASKTLHLLEARAGIWQSLQCWESRTRKEIAAFVVISSQNNLFEWWL